AGVKRTAVEDVLAALSMETSEGSIPDPSKHFRQRSKMHEVELDENKVVMHTRRSSTAIGVTPSDPSAIVDLFQEVESIGSTYLPPDETDSEDEDTSSSHHKEAAAAAASGGSAADSSDPPEQQQQSQSNADSASSVGSTTNEQQQHVSSDENLSASAAAAAAAGDSQKHRVGPAGKLWAQQEQQAEPSSPLPPPPSDTPVQMVEPAWGSGEGPPAPRPYWPTNEAAAEVA
ncbi:unnamed protein product, partial [Ectocarpus fasciculatus]